MNSIAVGRARSSKRVRASLAALAAAALLGAALGPASAGAETGAESLYGPSMRLAFTGGKAKLTGVGAVVAVKCKGPRGGTCAGTVSLRFAGATHKAPFSIAGGNRQRVVVPLGADGERARHRRAHAVASTAQPLGAYRHAARVLRLG